ncbi:MAG: hypothetical protein KDK54_01985 [Leptospiraceae bacterium]|nr:hypothetical protein [Leptospiraceae bacterium]
MWIITILEVSTMGSNFNNNKYFYIGIALLDFENKSILSLFLNFLFQEEIIFFPLIMDFELEKLLVTLSEVSKRSVILLKDSIELKTNSIYLLTSDKDISIRNDSIFLVDSGSNSMDSYIQSKKKNFHRSTI